MQRYPSALIATFASLAVLFGLLAPTPANAAGGAAPGVSAQQSVEQPQQRSAIKSGWKPRRAKYKKTVTRKDLPIKMEDGVVLRGDLTLPAKANGKAVPDVPVVVTITAYNKTVLGAGAGAVLAGSDPAYLISRGYAQLTVDARGTGSSEGQWSAFSKREGKDAAEIVEWAHRQRWSNGKVAMTGASYMGISQLFAAAHKPKGLKAIFPQVPAGDVYRDVVASGGQIDVGFIPLWLGLVTGTGLIPPAYTLTDPSSALQWALDHLLAATTFTGPLMLTAILGGNPAYDGPFYKQRSPLSVIDRVKVPTFLIAGEHDLFQRGTPLLFERLQAKGVPTRIITGPWDHLEGSSGAEVGKAGYGSLAELQLRWFDKYVMRRKDKALMKDIKPFTYFEQGTGKWVRTGRYVASDIDAKSLRLSGSASIGGRAGQLKTQAKQAKPGKAIVPAIPVTGLCTRSANQWTAGILNAAWPDNPCLQDNRYNDFGGVVYETGKLKKKLRIQGPINARLYASTPSGDGMLSVAVESVAPSGKVTRLTGGWQTIAHRKLIRSKSRYVDGQLLQPWHPFTKSAKKPLPRGKVAPIDVEIFPTGAAIKPGHRLRLSIQAFDVPHLLSPIPDLPAQLVPLTVHSSKKHPSVLTIPTR